jgi:hypothetical protein
MRAPRADDEVAEESASVYTTARTLDLWRLLRLVCGVQGGYYLLTGLWLLADRFINLPGPWSVTRLTGRDFGNDVVVGLTVLIGIILLVSTQRQRPDGLFTGLGFGTALAFFVAEWRYRGPFSNWIYLELLVELVFMLALFGSFWAAVIADRRRR